jgi:hypothetical protein
MNMGLVLSRFPDLTGLLVGTGLIGVLVLTPALLGVHRLRSCGTRQPEAADYGDDQPPKTGMPGNEDRIPPPLPEN